MESRHYDWVSFGIGCFHFGVKKHPPFKFEGSAYIKALHKALNSISNIDNLKIDCNESFKKLSVKINEKLPSIRKKVGVFPNPFRFKIEFDLYLPLRIQKELFKFKTIERTPRTYTEKFRIHMHYTYHLPVTFVECVNPSKVNNPSDGVIVLRKFLEKEFEKSKSDFIRFEWLGPSPFHVNCYIHKGKPTDDGLTDWTFYSERPHIKYGYDVVDFYFNPKSFKNVEDVMPLIKEESSHELGFFYKFNQGRSKKIRKWSQIDTIIEELNSIQGMKGIKGGFKRTFCRNKIISQAITAIAELETDIISLKDFIQVSLDSIYSGKEVIIFKTDIDKAIQLDYSYPTKEMTQLLNFFEQRRVKSLEMLIVIISAIIGGSIGALITILLAL